MTYMSYDEFTARFAPLKELFKSEVREKAVNTALEQASRAIDSKLSVAYEVPINTTDNTTNALLKRWVFYLTLKELLASNAVVLSNPEGGVSFLSEAIEMVERELDQYATGSYSLPSVPVKLRPRIGFGFSQPLEETI